MPDTLEAAPPAAAEKPSERASFRLAAFAVVLVVVLIAGYGVGRLNESGTSAGDPGRYRMFFDFQVGGKVHTAAWTAIVS